MVNISCYHIKLHRNRTYIHKILFSCVLKLWHILSINIKRFVRVVLLGFMPKHHSNIANYPKYNYFWDCDGIDNVTLRLWKFSDFCSRHIVGVAGDDIMFHILVSHVCANIPAKRYVCHVIYTFSPRRKGSFLCFQISLGTYFHVVSQNDCSAHTIAYRLMKPRNKYQQYIQYQNTWCFEISWYVSNSTSKQVY